jgi:hypothetical protein
MLKWLLRLLKLYKLSRCHMALNCSCVFSLLIFGVRSVFPYWCRGLIFGATCKAILQCLRASWVCLYYPVYHVLMLFVYIILFTMFWCYPMCGCFVYILCFQSWCEWWELSPGWKHWRIALHIAPKIRPLHHKGKQGAPQKLKDRKHLAPYDI